MGETSDKGQDKPPNKGHTKMYKRGQPLYKDKRVGPNGVCYSEVPVYITACMI